MSDPTRRRWLLGAGGTLAALAGCNAPLPWRDSGDAEAGPSGEADVTVEVRPDQSRSDGATFETLEVDFGPIGIEPVAPEGTDTPTADPEPITLTEDGPTVNIGTSGPDATTIADATVPADRYDFLDFGYQYGTAETEDGEDLTDAFPTETGSLTRIEVNEETPDLDDGDTLTVTLTMWPVREEPGDWGLEDELTAEQAVPGE